MDVCFIDGTVLTLPSDGGTLELGRGRPECLTDPHLSRRQCWLRTFPGQTRVELRAVATNAREALGAIWAFPVFHVFGTCPVPHC